MKQYYTRLWLYILVLSLPIIASEPLYGKKKKGNEKEKEAIIKPQEPKSKIKKYTDIITPDAISDSGLFTVHKVKEKFYFEIPTMLYGREMLMVSRVAKTTYGMGFGGGKTNTQVLAWEKKEGKIILKIKTYDITADEELPINEAVTNSNFSPILTTFPIKTYGKDSAAVIEANSLLEKDLVTLGIPLYYRKRYKMGKPDRERSYIERISSYPQNIELRHVKTYPVNNPPTYKHLNFISVEMSNSMILLPKEPMKRRLYDRRVGWFTSNTIDFGLEAQKSQKVKYLDRWRLEVKEEDIEKFKRGERVVPKKQIVYYIDRATPKKWIPYIKQGVEDWQVAFEEAGFKEAIVAKLAPTIEENPEWSPEDVRYSTIRYLASTIPNANGPHVSDPRSGEILESDINWYHNVMTLLRRWFFVQTAAINPSSQAPEFSDEVMGRLIRFVSAHEVGHTLGLPHNFASSVAYHVDSLRSPSFTKEMGTAPSIMDYARFNYVAQPEDGPVALMPNIGLYDKYAIAWGYRPILDAATPEEEVPTLSSWIEEKKGDPIYRYGRQGNSKDYTAQSEDLGHDAMLASMYGIKNLKRIVPNLQKWTFSEQDPYINLKEMYNEVHAQFSRYMGHVSRYVGGVKENYKTVNQSGAVYTHAPRDKQKEAVLFLNENLFKTPTWMVQKEILGKIQDHGAVDKIKSLQTRTLGYILHQDRLSVVIENSALNGKNAYSIISLFEDLHKGIWSELKTKRTIDVYRRNLQKVYVDKVGRLLDYTQEDISSVARADLSLLKREINAAIPKMQDKMSRFHLQDILERVTQLLDRRSIKLEEN